MEAEIGVTGLLASTWWKKPLTKECKQPLDAEKGKSTDSPVEPPEGM